MNAPHALPSRPQTVTYVAHPSGKPLEVPPSRTASRGQLSGSTSRLLTPMTSPPLSLSGSLPRLQLLKSSSAAKLRAELAMARAAHAREADKARQCSWKVAALQLQQDYRRHEHEGCLRRERELVAKAAKEELEIARSAKDYEDERARNQERRQAFASLVAVTRKPTLSLFRSESMPPDTFAQSTSPRSLSETVALSRGRSLELVPADDFF